MPRSLARRVLVIEDEPLVRDLVSLNLTYAGYVVATADDAPTGLEALVSNPPDVAIVDLMLPRGDGLTIVRKAREAGVRCPVLLLTARADTPSKVRGLDAGADDYLTKPFDIPELLARIRALLRRAGVDAPPIRRLSFGTGWIALDTGQAMTSEGEIVLTGRELRLMDRFAAHEDRVLSRTDLVEEVWGLNASEADPAMDDFIMRLRHLFEPDPKNPVHFVTIGGGGYLFRRAPPPA